MTATVSPARAAWYELLISASEISEWHLCQRRWGFGYVEGIRGEQHPAAALGTEVDDEQIQPYLREGRSFDFSKPSGSGEIAASMLQWLPQPKTVQIQRKIEIPSPSWATEGFGYIGFMDIFAEDSALLPGLPGGAPCVADTKTTSDINKWAKTEKSLLTDPQAMLYATEAMFATGARVVDMAWIYGQTRGARKSKRVHVRVDADHVAEQFSKINDTAILITKARRELLADDRNSPLDLPPDPSACMAFNKPCPHTATCNLGPGQIAEAFAAKAERLITIRKGNDDMATTDMLASLKARSAAKAAAAAGAAPAAAAAPPPAAPSTPPPAAPPPPPAPPPAAVAAPGPSVGINPPESALPPAPPVGAAAQAAAPAAAKPRASRTKSDATIKVDVEGAEVVTFRVVWGEEAISPIQYSTYRTGPFEATGVVQPGETLTDAMARVYGELAAFAEGIRGSKAASFATTFKK